MEHSMESFTPTILEELTYDTRAYGTMLVELWKCPLCAKWMVWPNLQRDFLHGTFPGFYRLDFNHQLQAAGWVKASDVEVEGRTICTVCVDAGKAYFVCALCDQKQPTAEILNRYGSPPDFLCKTCYQRVPASEWDAKEDELREKHRYDYD